MKGFNAKGVCAIFSCTLKLRQEHADFISWHSFPDGEKLPGLWRLWVTAIRRANKKNYWRPKSDTRLCSRHFEDKYLNCKDLRKDAVPSRNLESEIKNEMIESKPVEIDLTDDIEEDDDEPLEITSNLEGEILCEVLPTREIERKKCIVCLNYFAAGDNDIEILSDIDGVVKTLHDDQLPGIFLLRRLLNVSKDVCTQLLQEFGDPKPWINFCESCSALVTNAKSVFDKIIALQKQFETFQSELKDLIILSIKPEEMLYDEMDAERVVGGCITERYKNSAESSPVKVRFQRVQGLDSVPDSQPENNSEQYIMADCDEATYVFDPDSYHDTLPVENSQFEIVTEATSALETEECVDTSDLIASDLIIKCDPGSLLENEEVEIFPEAVNEDLESNQYLLEENKLEYAMEDSDATELEKLSDEAVVINVKNSSSCYNCGKIFIDNGYFLEHAETHLREIHGNQCPICGKVFASLGNLKEHFLAHTRDTKSFKRELGGPRFTYSRFSKSQASK